MDAVIVSKTHVQCETVAIFLCRHALDNDNNNICTQDYVVNDNNNNILKEYVANYNDTILVYSTSFFAAVGPRVNAYIPGLLTILCCLLSFFISIKYIGVI